jgi:6-pyruvoyltetrahydropterin/6-carboxytetrahydropterin synthase
MSKGFSITRRIEIDMGHRVTTHGSKCWNLHGHRYVILATAVSTQLHVEGAQTDMVMDFGFLKDVMMDTAHLLCDHGLVLWAEDPWLTRFIRDHVQLDGAIWEAKTLGMSFFPENRDASQTKLLVVNFIPTAERLGQFWYEQMKEPVVKESGGLAKLSKVEVFETPNCSAVYPEEVHAD